MMMIAFRVLVLRPFLILTIISFLHHSVSALNPTYCKCKYLIRRSAVTFGACGSCALCYWNLFYFASNFEKNDPTLQTNVKYYEDNFKECAKLIPIEPTSYPDKSCAKSAETCQIETDAFFTAQCDLLYGPKSGEPLPPPEPVSAKGLAKFKSGINATYKKPPKFDGKSDYFFPRTCPSHHRRYQFTFYLLFDAAYRKYLGEKPAKGEWTEELGLVEIASHMSFDTLRETVENLEKSLRKFGYGENNINPKRFCGHSDVFVCVDEHKGPMCLTEYGFWQKGNATHEPKWKIGCKDKDQDGDGRPKIKTG